MRPEELKELIVTLRELNASYKEMGNAMKGVVNETKFLKRLIGDPNPEAQRSWLIAAGIALIAFPDPTISDLIGAILVAAGLAKSRMKQPSIVDAYKAFHGTVRELNEIRWEFHTL